MTPRITNFHCLLFIVCCLFSAADSFAVAPQKDKQCKAVPFLLFASNNPQQQPNKSNKEEKRGYRFGDITRSLGQKLTGDENYEFGDISRNLDRQAKARVESLTGKPYVFGDLSKWADFQVKEKVANFTGKDTYQVGDLSKEVVRRVWEGEYELEDIILVLRILLQMGAQFTPIARLMPVHFLLEVLGVGVAQDVGGKIMAGVAKSVDERFKTAITGDPKYQLGDKSKERIVQALSKITGKENYQFGDLTQVIAQRVAEMENSRNASGSSDKNNKSAKLAADLGKELLELSEDGALKEWDRKYMEQGAATVPKKA